MVRTYCSLHIHAQKDTFGYNFAIYDLSNRIIIYNNKAVRNTGIFELLLIVTHLQWVFNQSIKKNCKSNVNGAIFFSENIYLITLL